MHGITYEFKCQECGDKYIGETARNAYLRALEHADGMDRENEKSVLWTHCIEKHGSLFQMSVTGSYGNDAMLSQIAKSVRLAKIPTGFLINSKKEWNYFKLPHAIIEEKDG